MMKMLIMTNRLKHWKSSIKQI